MEVKVLKLMSGEEIISNYDMHTNLYVKPRVLQLMPDGQGGARAGLVPWIMSAPDAIVPIFDGCIATVFDAPMEISRSYLESTSGIALS